MTVELRARGSHGNFIAELLRDGRPVFTFIETSGSQSEENALAHASSLLCCPLADRLAEVLGDSFDVRALALVDYLGDSFDVRVNALIDYKGASHSRSLAQTNKDARSAAVAVRKALKYCPERFVAIRNALGPDLVEVCSKLDALAGEPAKQGKRTKENKATRAIRRVCLHWRAIRETEPLDNERDIEAIATILVACGIKEAKIRNNNKPLLHRYVRNLVHAARLPSAQLDIPSPRDVAVATFGQGKKTAKSRQ